MEKTTKILQQMQLNNNREEYLSFGRIIDRGANIFEIIAHPDMEINTGHLKEINDFIGEQSPGNDSAILINRKHSYHYSFEAMKQFGTISSIQAIAVLAETRKSYIRSKTVVETFYNISKNSKIKIFRDRTRAMEWLHGQIKSTDNEFK